MIGIELRHLRVGGASASWGSVLTERVQAFLLEDAEFLAWAQRRGFRVTETTLKEFPLYGIRSWIDAEGLENVTNSDGQPVLPLLDDKIRRKMAAVYRKLPHDQRQQRLRTRSTVRPRSPLRCSPSSSTIQMNNNFFTR